MRGDGRVLKRARGGYQICYYAPGKGEKRESVARLLGKPAAKVTEQEARRTLQRRISEVRLGEWRDPETRRITVARLLDEYEEHCQVRKVKDLATMRSRTKRIKAEFGDERAEYVTLARLRKWVIREEANNAAPATIAALLAQLRAAMRVAKGDQRLKDVPMFPTIRVSNVRQGFAEADAFWAIQRRLPDVVGDAVITAHGLGRRIGEVLSWQWPLVDRRLRVVRVTMDDTKTDNPDVVPLVGEVWEVITRRWAARALGVPFVFHRKGKALTYRHVYAQWKKAATAAGYPDLHIHDLRRTAYRDMLEAGVDPFTARDITGHKTDTMAKRYAIKNTRLMRQGLERRQAALRALNTTDAHAAAGAVTLGQFSDTQMRLAHESGVVAGS